MQLEEEFVIYRRLEISIVTGRRLLGNYGTVIGSKEGLNDQKRGLMALGAAAAATSELAEPARRERHHTLSWTNELESHQAKFAMRRLTQFIARILESASRRVPNGTPAHLRTARRGEMEAYLYLRNHGYRLVATNLRVRQSRGEIDLIGWDNEILCFIEVKTRTAEGIAPPEAAVDRQKKQHILSVARRYVRRLPGTQSPRCRFDVVSIVLGPRDQVPEIRLIKGAFSWDTGRPSRYEYSRPSRETSWRSLR